MAARVAIERALQPGDQRGALGGLGWSLLRGGISCRAILLRMRSQASACAPCATSPGFRSSSEKEATLSMSLWQEEQ
jgi:hypothetical protein